MAGFPFTYAVTPTDVQVRLGAWVVRRVALNDIERVDVRPFGADLLMNEHWTNLDAMGGLFVLLRRRSGWIRNFLINPSDPEGFVAALRREAPHLVPP